MGVNSANTMTMRYYFYEQREDTAVFVRSHSLTRLYYKLAGLTRLLEYTSYKASIWWKFLIVSHLLHSHPGSGQAKIPNFAIKKVI